MELTPSVLQDAIDLDLRRDSSFAATVLSRTIVSKFIPTDPSLLRELDLVAIESFTVANSLCREVCLEIEPNLLVHLRKCFEDLCFAGGYFLFDETEIFKYMRHGPGASIGAKCTSHPSKDYLTTYTYTSNYVLALAVTARHLSPTSSFAEITRQDLFGVKRVSGSRTSCVPKNKKTSRLICTEPLLNMEAQLAIGCIIEKGLKRIFNISLDSQPDVNKSMAKKGSIDGSFATVDLKSASDLISMKLLELIAPEAFVELIKQVRSPSTDLSGEDVPLHMVSTMGNGFTFPLQTFLFASIAAYVSGTSRAPRNWSVFGDDIVIRNSCYGPLLKSLTMCGLIVNEDKSFSRGPFRESCGGDYHNGDDVRGVYVKRLSQRQDYYVAFNLLLKWSILHNRPLHRTAELLYNSVDKEDRFKIPFWESDDAGFKSFEPPKPVVRNCIPSYRYKCLKIRPRVLTFKRFMREGGTLSGWFESMLRGCESNHTYIRANVSTRVVTQRFTSLWDNHSRTGLVACRQFSLFLE